MGLHPATIPLRLGLMECIITRKQESSSLYAQLGYPGGYESTELSPKTRLFKSFPEKKGDTEFKVSFN